MIKRNQRRMNCNREGKIFGNQLYHYLVHKNIKQKELCEALNFKPAHLNKILHGRTNVFIDDVIAILDYLGVTLEFVMKGGWVSSLKLIADPSIPNNQIQFRHPDGRVDVVTL